MSSLRIFHNTSLRQTCLRPSSSAWLATGKQAVLVDQQAYYQKPSLRPTGPSSSCRLQASWEYYHAYFHACTLTQSKALGFWLDMTTENYWSHQSETTPNNERSPKRSATLHCISGTANLYTKTDLCQMVMHTSLVKAYTKENITNRTQRKCLLQRFFDIIFWVQAFIVCYCVTMCLLLVTPPPSLPCGVGWYNL